MCTASKVFIKKKLDSIEAGDYNDEQKALLRAETLDKACICIDLAGAAKRKCGIDPEAAPCLCPGPNMVNFDRTYSLEEMVSHIYGRISLLKNPERPHMFVRELMLYVDYLKDEIEHYRLSLSVRTPKYFVEFRENLIEGIEHYMTQAEQLIEEGKMRFLDDLAALREEIESGKISMQDGDSAEWETKREPVAF